MNTEEEREERIQNEIIVDAYNDEEVKMGWYTYMQDELQFPFTATTMIKRRSGQYKKQTIDVLDLAEADDNYFGNDMMLEAAYTEDIFIVPMTELTNIQADESTTQALEDWKYWKKKYPYR